MNDTDAAKLLWEEYKYRHSHTWITIRRFTLAIVAVAIAPYLGREVLGGHMSIAAIVLLVLSFVMVVVTCIIIVREYERMSLVRVKYLPLLGNHAPDTPKEPLGTLIVSSYGIAMGIMTIGNSFVYCFAWPPGP